MSVTIRTSVTTTHTDANNNVDDDVGVSVNRMTLNSSESTMSTTTGGKTSVGSRFQGFGTDYNTKKTNTSIQQRTGIGGRAAQNKYTPSLNNKPKSTASSRNPGRFQGIQRDEPPVPSIGGSAGDRMAHFREAMEKEKAQKEREEEKKRKAEEKKKEDEEKKKQEELEKKMEEEKKAAEPPKDESVEDPTVEANKSVAPCKKKRVKKQAQRTMSISNIVMDWVQEMTKDYEGVEIKNFSTSWSNGLAFCALIHKFNPDEFDFTLLTPENRRHNFDLAFETGQKVKKIPLLLDTNDLLRMKRPEPRSIQTYVQWIWSVYGPDSGYGPTPEEIQNATIA